MAKGITADRYHGRWYGIILCLGEQSGRDVTSLLRDKATEMLTMLQMSNEYPDEFQYVNQLMELEKQKESEKQKAADNAKTQEFLLGNIEAKYVFQNGRKWELLLEDKDLDTNANTQQQGKNTTTDIDKTTKLNNREQNSDNEAPAAKTDTELKTEHLKSLFVNNGTDGRNFNQMPEQQDGINDEHEKDTGRNNTQKQDLTAPVQTYQRPDSTPKSESGKDKEQNQIQPQKQNTNHDHPKQLHTDDESANELYQEGCRYMNGEGVPQDFQRGFELFKQAAELGNPAAITSLADCYLNGVGTDFNAFRAVDYYKEAAERGYTNAKYKLAVLYMKGRGVEKNEAEGLCLLNQAAEEGNVDAQTRLGVLYFTGKDMDCDDNLAFKWLDLAAPYNSEASYYLSKCWLLGRGTQKNEQKALELLEAAANQGYPQAQYEIGASKILQHHNYMDYKVAAEWFEMAAQQGHKKAQMELVNFYTNGLGVQKNPQRAAFWRNQAQGNNQNTPNGPNGERAGGCAITICFFFPIVGLIMYFVQKNKVENPGAYFGAGCLGVILNIILRLIFFASMR